MEILVESADEGLLTDDTLLSVRFGGVRRQVPLSKASKTPLCFPTLLGRKDPRNIKFDVLTRVGSGWLMPRPEEERYKVPVLGCGSSKSLTVRIAPSQAKGAAGGGHAPARPGTAPARTADGLDCMPSRPGTADAGASVLQGALGLGACAADEATETLENDAPAGGSEKRRDKAKSAKDYLEHHQVITFVHALLHALLKERPADPYAFMAQHLPKPGDKAAPCGKERAQDAEPGAAQAAETPAGGEANAEEPSPALPQAQGERPAAEPPAPALGAPADEPGPAEASVPPALEEKPRLLEEPVEDHSAEAEPHREVRRVRLARPTVLDGQSHAGVDEREDLRLNCAVLDLQVKDLQRENDQLLEKLQRAGEGVDEIAEQPRITAEHSAIVRCLSPPHHARRKQPMLALTKTRTSPNLQDDELFGRQPMMRRRPTLIKESTEFFKKVGERVPEEADGGEEDEVDEDELEEPPPPPVPVEDGLQRRARSELVARLSQRIAPGGKPPVYITEKLDKFWRRLRGEGDSADEYRVLRQSVFTGRWTLYSAGGKNKKPHQYNYGRRTPHLLEVPRCEGRCPFCVGNEHNTPPPVLFFDKDGQMHDGMEGTELSRGWLCRVIPNIFPLMVTPPGLYGEVFQNKLAQIPHSAAARGQHANEDLFAKPQDPHDKDCLEATTHRQVNAVGYSEVVIENPLHNGLLAIVDSHQVFLALRALQSRGRVLSKQPKVRQLLYFKQYGANSGGSLVHPHMQVVTLPLLTPETQNRLERAVDFYHRFGKCSVCHCLIEEPLSEDGHACSRLIHQTEHFLVVVPFASNQYRVSIVPREHSHSWLNVPQDELEELAEVLQLVMEALFHGLEDPEYNVYFHSIDKEEEVLDAEAVHWVLEVHPRFPAELGGVELASGIRVISGLPEDWAQEFRGHINKRLEVRRRRSKACGSQAFEPGVVEAGKSQAFQRVVTS